MVPSPPTTFSLEHVLHAEHARLVRLCAHLTGDRDAADDLAQETLIEAWRHRHKLVAPDGVNAWLNAIARNVCLRWACSHGRELARTTPLDLETHESRAQFEIDVELEHDELATLLDRALALLPPDTRDVLVQTYIHESPHAEIAERLGLSANAVAVRVHRGKLLLRRVLVNEFPDDAAAYGLIAPHCGGWQETRIWCARCGQRRLQGYLNPKQGAFALRCAACFPEPDACFARAELPDILHGVKGYKAALAKLWTWLPPYIRRAATQHTSCRRCGGTIQVYHDWPAEAPGSCRNYAGLHLRCLACNDVEYTSLNGLALQHPHVRQFWRTYPRIRSVPEHQVEANGRTILLTRFEAVDGLAHIDVLFDRETLQLVGVEGANHD